MVWIGWIDCFLIYAFESNDVLERGAGENKQDGRGVWCPGSTRGRYLQQQIAANEWLFGCKWRHTLGGDAEHAFRSFESNVMDNWTRVSFQITDSSCSQLCALFKQDYLLCV